jgi:hypothetical protein
MKIVVKVNDSVALAKRFRAEPQTAMREVITHVRNVVTETLEQVMNAEMDLVLGENKETGNKRNGYTLRFFSIDGHRGDRCEGILAIDMGMRCEPPTRSNGLTSSVSVAQSRWNRLGVDTLRAMFVVTARRLEFGWIKTPITASNLRPPQTQQATRGTPRGDHEDTTTLNGNKAFWSRTQTLRDLKSHILSVQEKSRESGD